MCDIPEKSLKIPLISAQLYKNHLPNQKKNIPFLFALQHFIFAVLLMELLSELRVCEGQFIDQQSAK